MKQYLDQQQTAKLIELGFEKKKVIMQFVPKRGAPKVALIDPNFSIGELIEMLPKCCRYKYGDKTYRTQLQIKYYMVRWHVVYSKFESDHCGYLHECFGEELIDALYDMVIKLKEEGII